MELLTVILAALGFAAALRHLLHAAFRAIRYGTYVLYAREIAATRARRGDLTGLEEAEEWVGIARRERRQALGGSGLWLGLLLLPTIFVARTVPVYTAYLVLWLVPVHTPRHREFGRPGGATIEERGDPGRGP